MSLIPGQTTDAIGKLCRELKVYFHGIMIEKDSRTFQNAAALISSRGELLACCRKVHLFSAEKAMFAGGTEPTVVKTELGTFGLTK